VHNKQVTKLHVSDSRSSITDLLSRFDAATGHNLKSKQ